MRKSIKLKVKKKEITKLLRWHELVDLIYSDGSPREGRILRWGKGAKSHPDLCSLHPYGSKAFTHCELSQALVKTHWNLRKGWNINNPTITGGVKSLISIKPTEYLRQSWGFHEEDRQHQGGRHRLNPGTQGLPKAKTGSSTLHDPVLNNK